MQVKFADEQGVDEGGPSREFLQLVVRECFSPNFGMFQSDPDARTFCMRASHIHQMLDEFELIGTILSSVCVATRTIVALLGSSTNRCACIFTICTCH